MAKTSQEIQDIIKNSPARLEEGHLPATAKEFKKIIIQVPNDCGVTAEEYMQVITRPLEV